MAPMSIEFALRFDRSQVTQLGSRYIYKSDVVIESEVGPRAKHQGCFTRDDFLSLCRWKARRAERHYVQNADADVRAVTGLALSTKDERLRICLLMALHGVNWPIASVMLHFGAQDRYPILDVRALWSVGVQKPSFYTFDLWWMYTQFCRELADDIGVTMRTLDRALWQYSKENQPAAAKRAGAVSGTQVRQEE
jgi:hypothetical protein